METSTHPKAFVKRHGFKKVFSVPVGKLRSNIITPGRNGSSSRSDRNVSHHKALLRNNRELARALSHEKERIRGVVTENVNLKARNHEAQLEVHGLGKQLDKSRQSLIVYQNTVMNHLKDAVKYSVSLTESLKLAMGISCTESKDSQIIRNVVSSCSIPISAGHPQRLRVNPMVGGHTIRHPTINLRRVVMNSENKIADGNETPGEQQLLENFEDVSRSIEETQERPGGLSTCLEEDEDFNGNINLNESADEEEDNEDDDSIRRKVVSFRNTTFEDKNRPGLETVESSSSNEKYAHQTVEPSFFEQGNRQNCQFPNNYKQPDETDKPCIKRNPVVALNDISRFLQNSNSVNVQKVILDIHNSKLGGKVGHRALEGSANEKENCPKSAHVNKSNSKQPCVSSGVDSQLLNGPNDLCMEGSIGMNNFPNDEKRNTVSNNATKEAISKVRIEEDPLEGTSWMHMHLFSDSKKRSKTESTKFSNETSSEESECKKVKGSSRKIVNASREKISDCMVTDQPQEDSEVLMDDMKESADEYDVSDFEIGLKNCPLAQSTPMSQCKPSQNGSASDVSKFSSKSNGDNDCINSFVSLNSSVSQGNKWKEGERNLEVTPIDTKLDGKAFVTVRVKRLKLLDLPPTNKVVSDSPELGDSANQISDEEVNFLGFAANADASERLETLKNIMNSESELEGRDICGSSSAAGTISSMCGSSVIQDTASCIEVEIADAPANERPKRRAAPKELKERNLMKKLRRESTGNKKSTKKKKIRG